MYNWIPYKITKIDEKERVYWLDIENKRFDEPFFDETISSCKINMANRSKFLPTSDLGLIKTISQQVESIPINAFIFHVSRCGSTLLSQCLSAVSTNIVVAEAPILDEILQNSLHKSEEEIELLFKETLKILGQKRHEENLFFVKLDSWHLNNYEQLRKWFPNTPFYFLIREPKAIIQSHQKRRGIHMIPGYLPTTSTNVIVKQEHFENFDLYTADVLEIFYQKIALILAFKNSLDVVFDYKNSPEKMIYTFNTLINNQLIDLESMVKRTNYHSKFPNQSFSEENPDWTDFPHTSCLQHYLKLEMYE